MRRYATACAVLLVVLSLAPGAPAVDRFEPGSVQSQAQSMRVGGFIGGTEAIITFGRAIARAQEEQGNAQAQAVDLGLFGLILSQPNACTGSPPIPPDQIPKPQRVSSVQGDRSATHQTADGQFVRGASEYVDATTKPSASGRTEVGQFTLPGAVSFDGLRSLADASITASAGRRDTTASTSLSWIDLAGGVVRIEGLRWDMAKTTGRGARSTNSFSVGRILLSGVPLPVSTPAQLAQAFDTVNAALGSFGLQLTGPSFRKHTDGTIEVTPLIIRFGGNDQSALLLGPLLRQLQPLRDQVYTTSQQIGCPLDKSILNAGFTVVDLALAGLTGSGGLTLEVGGVQTIHDTRVFGNPLLNLPTFVPPPPVVSRPPVTIAGRTTNSPGTTKYEAQPGVAGRVSTRCVTTHPSGSPGCSNGRAVLAGFLSIIVVLGLLGADLYRSRKREAAS